MSATDWIKTSTDTDALRRVMKKASDQGIADVAQAAFQRLREVAGAGHDDPLHREMWEGVAALEEIHALRRGKRVPAHRTRRKLNTDGVEASLESWALRKKETEGFGLMKEFGSEHLTAEYLVVKYADRFSEKAVEAAKSRLTANGIDYSAVTSSGDI